MYHPCNLKSTVYLRVHDELKALVHGRTFAYSDLLISCWKDPEVGMEKESQERKGKGKKNDSILVPTSHTGPHHSRKSRIVRTNTQVQATEME